MTDPTQTARLTRQATFGRKQAAHGTGGMVVTSHPVVTEVALRVLRDGGNAVDAAMAASVAQTVVEPHMTSICGTLSLLHHDASSARTTYLNGSMERPRNLESFSPADVTSGRSVPVPGFWAAFESAVERHGTRSTAELVAPAVELAEEGFEVYPFLYGMAFERASFLGRRPEARAIFMPEGRLLDVGETLRQPALAETLGRLASEGADYFYRGDLARRLVETVQGAGGVLDLHDLDQYEVRWLEPARGTYRGYDVIGSPPPDTGGTHVIEILNILEQLPLQEWGPALESPDTLYWLMRACNEVMADGAAIPDPRFRDVPLDLILSKERAQHRLDLMRMSAPRPTPPGPTPGSNHITVVDGRGNIASVLHSIMSYPWTNGLYVDGVQVWAGAIHFLRHFPVAGGRGTCPVVPTIVLRDGRPVLTAGSPSMSLVANVVQNTVNILDFGMDVESSVHLPRFGAQSDAALFYADAAPPATMIEADVDEALRHEVEARGIPLDVHGPWSHAMGSYEGVHIDAQGVMSACADPRRAGRAAAV